MESALAADGGASLPLTQFDYDLPPERIAQEPAAERDQARLMALDRRRGTLAHRVVSDVPALLRAGDVLVLNDTRVRPARLRGRTESGGAVELLFVRALDGQQWQCIGGPSKRLRTGAVIRVAADVRICIQTRLGEGRYIVTCPAGVNVAQLLRDHGEIPLPPYIARRGGVLALDRERYQTVFARAEGAVAAPTAGLHFTPGLLTRVREIGVTLAWLTLHVGPGTFLPIRADDARAHTMEGEWASIPAATADAVNSARRDGRRVVAVGTTTVRALESAAAAGTGIRSGEMWADTFILPGFSFRVTDALLTNFHLPRSTLLMLVAAFAGRERILAAYAEAVHAGYRFYSYGDAMLIS